MNERKWLLGLAIPLVILLMFAAVSLLPSVVPLLVMLAAGLGVGEGIGRRRSVDYRKRWLESQGLVESLDTENYEMRGELLELRTRFAQERITFQGEDPATMLDENHRQRAALIQAQAAYERKRNKQTFAEAASMQAYKHSQIANAMNRTYGRRD